MLHSSLEKMKYATAALLLGTCTVSLFVLLFRTILNPYIATQLANFDPEPVICKRVQSDKAFRVFNYTFPPPNVLNVLDECPMCDDFRRRRDVAGNTVSETLSPPPAEIKNCPWSSCKEVCTVDDQFGCEQIYVNYMYTEWKEFIEPDKEYEDDDDIWVGRGVPLFVNIQACGYQPHTNCSMEKTYFPCYYSRANPNIVITNYSVETL